MRSFRQLVALPLVSLVAACGGHSAAPPSGPAATVVVGGGSIAERDVQANLRYASHYFSAAYPGSQAQSISGCRTSSRSNSCPALRRKVIARMIQEQVVLEYAKSHHITLDNTDRSRVENELKTLLSPTSDTADLFDHSSGTRTFLRSILTTQALVLKVEGVVAGPQASRGPAYHLVKVTIPPGPRAHQEALTLATDGKPVPQDAIVRDEWEAPFRLTAQVSAAISVAHSGDFIGPFRRHGAYLVIHVLGQAQHAYGRPARTILLTRIFQRWLRQEVARAQPHCSRPADTTACDLARMKNV